MSPRRARSLALACSLAMAVIGVALASSSAGALVRSAGGGFQVLFGGGGKVLAQYVMPVRARGELAITFHGDPGTGCARRGLCAYSGQIALRPGGPGELILLKIRQHDRTSYQAELVLNETSGSGFSEHTRRRSGSASGLCADLNQSLGFISGSGRADHIVLSLIQPGAGALSTRCAGPLDADLTKAVPRAIVSVGRVMHPGSEISFAGGHAFAGHGFAGSVTSTIKLRVGRSHRELLGPGPHKQKHKRVRILTEKVDLVSASGEVSAAIAGVADPEVCQLLDSCGLTGRLTWGPEPVRANGILAVSALASRPRRDLLAALGLSRRGNPHGLAVDGHLQWRDRGSVTERITQSGPCADSTGLGSGLLLLGGQTDIHATYIPSRPLRTRCPGPMLEPESNIVVAGTFARQELSHPRFTLHLLPGSDTHDDGYVARFSGRIVFELKPSRQVTQRVISEPRDAPTRGLS